jgi:hypothetical protein
VFAFVWRPNRFLGDLFGFAEALDVNPGQDGEVLVGVEILGFREIAAPGRNLLDDGGQRFGRGDPGVNVTIVVLHRRFGPLRNRVLL